MKKYILYALVLCSSGMLAQEALDTIYANDSKNVALFFPDPIRQGVTGADHFVFTYNRERGQYFGLLQAVPGTESNLLVVTANGQVYSYILKYSRDLPKLNYIIKEVESIGNEKPRQEFHMPSGDVMENMASGLDGVNRFCGYLLGSRMDKIASKRQDGLLLKLLEMAYHKEEVYLVLEVKNRSGIDFEIDYLDVYVTNENKRRNASFQKIRQEIIHKYAMPNHIGYGGSNRFVLVLPKFVLGPNGNLEIVMKERKGDRGISLRVKP